MVQSIKRILFTLVGGVVTLLATPGDLDSTFGDGGIVSTSVAGSNIYHESVAIQKDGKLVVAGYANEDPSEGYDNFSLVRYNSDGSLDASFGSGGMVTTDFAGSNDRAYSVAIQENGKIIVAGYAREDYSSEGGVNFALARYNSDGSLDDTFGRGGKVTTDVGGESDIAYSVAIQENGKIVLAGNAFIDSVITVITLGNNFALARYNSDGSLDDTFGGGGKVTTDLGGDTSTAYSVAIQDDGKIVATGHNQTYSYLHGNFALARYNSNGSLDGSFGNEGKVTTEFLGLGDSIRSVAIQENGKIVVAGYNTKEIPAGYNGPSNFALARYNSDGSLDDTFGSGGTVTTDFEESHARAYSVAIQDNDKIMVAGYTRESFPGLYGYVPVGYASLALARYNSDGNLDDTFGSEGMVTTDFEESNARAYSLAIQDDGKIVAAGDGGIARYAGDPTQRVDIDIIPNKSQNVIKYKIKKGKCHGAKVKVNMFSTSDFDVSLVDPLSVLLGDPKLEGKANPIKSKIKDVNHDGYDDIQFIFSICELVEQEALNTDTTKLILTGETPYGIIVTGEDMVKVKQKRGGKPRWMSHRQRHD